MPGVPQTVGTYFAEHPDSKFLTGDGTFVDASGTVNVGTVHAAPYWFQNLLEYCNDKYLPQPSVFFSRSAWLRGGELDIGLKYAMDLDLWLRMRQHVPLDYVPKTVEFAEDAPKAKANRWDSPPCAPWFK